MSTTQGWTLEEVEARNARIRRGERGTLLVDPAPARELDWTDMPIHQAIKADWTSPEILVEGSLNSAKSTLTLDKEIDALLKWPGIPILLWRWTQESLDTKLRPPFEQLLAVRGVSGFWDRDQHCYHFNNRSRVYAFGLKAASAIERMNKLRGLGVARILGDQVEEADRAVAEELRARLRPDLTATLSGVSYPFQLTFVANPSDHTFWLSREFPEDGHIKGRRLYRLSVFDNKYLPPSTIDTLLRTWPEGHPKHQTMVLGKRGLNIVGDAVYDGLYVRDVHSQPLVPSGETLLEAYELGKHNPVWLVAERTYHGALHLLGGVLAQGLALEDFLRVVRRVRAEWFPGARFKTTASPVGEKQTQTQARVTLLDILRQWGITPIWYDSANMPDVILTMIEELAGYLRRRTPSGREESFALNSDPDHWLIATRDGTKPQPWMSFAFEGGYIWEKDMVSVAHKGIKRPHVDDHYANAMRCVENILLTFCVSRPSDAERATRQGQDREAHVDNPFAHLGPLAWMCYLLPLTVWLGHVG